MGKKILVLETSVTLQKLFTTTLNSDDYTIQNTLKIMDIPYSGIITEGIKEIYNWKKVCQGCKKEFEEDYPFDDCDVCGSKIFKKRIRVSR